MLEIQEAIQYCQNVQDELVQLIKDLCAIAAPSHHEQHRATFIQKWYQQYNIPSEIDAKKNVIIRYKTKENQPIKVFMAHTDTVFPDETGFECELRDGKLCAPGVGDDTANCAQLMLICRYLFQHQLPTNYEIMVVHNSCEEGLGNSEGAKEIVSRFKENIVEFYSFDGSYDEAVDKAVGSVRYQIDIKTEGGHSYGAFGNRNAIYYASKMINELYQYQVPTRGKSTFNVGKIEGGTSVNSIAQDASFLFEYRSDNRFDLEEMKQYFDTVLTKYRQQVISLDCTILGIRPCMGDVDEGKMKEIRQHIVDIVHKYSDKEIVFRSGSTDCNISFAASIPGCVFGGYIGDNAHRRDEWLYVDSLTPGMKMEMQLVLDSLI